VLAIRIVSQAGTLDTCQEQKCYQKNINATITTFLIVFMSHSFIVGLSSIVTMAYILLSRFCLLLFFAHFSLLPAYICISLSFIVLVEKRVIKNVLWSNCVLCCKKGIPILAKGEMEWKQKCVNCWLFGGSGN